MNILVLVEFRVDVVFLRQGAGQAHRDLRGFLHHVSQAAGEFSLSGAVQHEDFQGHHYAADGGPCESVHKPDLVVGFQVLRQELLHAEEIRNIRVSHGDLLFAGQQLLR